MPGKVTALRTTSMTFWCGSSTKSGAVRRARIRSALEKPRARRGLPFAFVMASSLCDSPFGQNVSNAEELLTRARTLTSRASGVSSQSLDPRIGSPTSKREDSGLEGAKGGLSRGWVVGSGSRADYRGPFSPPTLLSPQS